MTKKRWKTGDRWRSPIAVVAKTKNAKLSKNTEIAATYASQATCPKDCEWRNSGCYAEKGLTAFTTHRLNSNTETDPAVIAQIEADAMDKLSKPRKLRVHVVGDSATPTAAGITGDAMLRYEQRTGAKAYTYTHAWRTVPYESWNGARVLASVHTPSDLKHATLQGYTGVAISLPNRHPSRKAYSAPGFDIKIIPCPAQFKNSPVSCSNCNICQSQTLTAQGFAVGFQPDSLKKE